MLITGAGGFLGEQAVHRALAQGDRVVAVLSPRGDTKQFVDHFTREERQRLRIEKLDICDPVAVAELVARHTELDSVLHAAALVRPPKDTPWETIERMNVGATIALARACEGLAAGRGRPLKFHFISSLGALNYENGIVQANAATNADFYSHSKCEASHWLLDHAGELKHLDTRITYPPAMIGPVPSGHFITQILRLGERDDPAFATQQPNDPSYISELVHSANYLGDIFACFDDAPQPGVREYDVKPDYRIRMGEFVRLAKQVVSEKKHQLPPDQRDVGEQLEMDFTRHRGLPTVAEALGAPDHTDIKLRDVLAAQYDAIATERAKGRQ